MTSFDLDRYGKRIVQYFWDPTPKNDDPSSSPIWLLGRQYDPSPPNPPSLSSHTSPSDISTSLGSNASWVDDSGGNSKVEASSPDADTAADDGGWPPAFLDDFESRIWLTYRSNFDPIPKSADPKASSTMTLAVRLKSLGNKEGFTSDTGYGCMIRTGQSLLANALLTLRLGRDWRRGSEGVQERQLLSLFADDPKAPFSIHKFVHHGATACGKHPGEWFGPSATARCIQALTQGYREGGLRVYVTGDGSDVYEDGVLKIAKSEDGSFNPTLLLINIRLGINGITPVYWESLKASLQMSQSIGIAGGRPSASHYFVGTQNQHFFYLDPHYTRPALALHDQIESYTDEEIDTCHTRRLRRIHVKDMDPSMLIGFLVRDEEDWKAWRQGVVQTQGKPVIHVADKEPPLHGHGTEREGAIDEVEAFDDTEEEDP